ncbi:hypothetical protein CFIMG_000346RA [Ceratocystis fimbriata CBS 114723]|uniref:Survival Motor Neuron Gemin2-binding domain-containing protein n=1 Tax=Ceratocystis fimbriata CBS 114723 TaxID=1035309 RepID=A0A2C5XGW3_9PEZI|nr:hypothetical protein CFIMG_000346RA [Ceratocystis fimbriata CBS 114723]
MVTSTIDISNSDVWDDSALIASWNDALQEYKKYHSIFQKVRTEADLERELAAAGLGVNGELLEEANLDGPVVDDEYEPEYGEEEEEEKGISSDPLVESAKPEPSTSRPSVIPEQPPISEKLARDEAPSLQQGPLEQVKDETLKKALMGWYYAGYYTGLYEGMQKKESPTGDTRANDAPEA